jgi:hypothetical protein
VVKELGDGLLHSTGPTGVTVSRDLAGFTPLRPRDDAAVGASGLHWGRRRGGDDLVGHDNVAADRGCRRPAALCSSSDVGVVRCTTGPSVHRAGPVVMKGIPDPIDLYRVERVDIPRRDPVSVER